MSITLDGILAGVGDEEIVTLSGESVAILLHALRYLEDRENWLDYSESPLDEVTDADWDAIEKLVGNAAYEVMTPMVSPYPANFDINVMRGKLGVGGAMSPTIGNLTLTYHYTSITPAAINNRMDFDFFCRKGTYLLGILAVTASNQGQTRCYVDGTQTGSLLEWYAAGTTWGVWKTTSIAVPTDGQHVLGVKLESKHASSSAYNFFPSFIYGYRTGD